MKTAPRPPLNVESSNNLEFAEELDFSSILTNPILDIAARFWSEDRYLAFQVCYRSMRRIDDLVDDRKQLRQALSPQESDNFKNMIGSWLESVQQKEISDDFQERFIETLERFRIPFWPWERFGQAMAYDLDHNGYSTFLEFLRYAEGAAIAPASIFMHLCGLTLRNNGYQTPAFDIHAAARPLAIFAYLVHIIRDFQKDHQVGLNYFAADLMRERGLTIQDLKKIAEGGPVSDSFRDLIVAYARFTRYYQQRTLLAFQSVLPQLESRYQLSLQIVYNLYLQIFERVNIRSGNFSKEELNPPLEEVQKRLNQTIQTFQPVN